MLRLLPLALATFAVGTDNFVIAGLLPAMAEDLGVTVPVAGQLVTVFALTFAISAPVLGAATSGMNRRTALLLALAVFVAGNAATALGTSYTFVLVARIVTAAGAGIITSAASSTAVALVPPERRGGALALVMGGLSASTALGLPIGTLIGGANWRLTLWAVAGAGLVAALGIALGLPKVSLPAAGFRARLAPMKQPWVLGVLVVTMTALAGSYLLYPYVAAATEDLTGGSATTLTVLLLAWGLGTLAGTLIAGPLTDRYRPERVLAVSLFAATLVLAISPIMMAGLASAVVWASLWGLCIGIPVIPQQHRLVAHAPAASPILLGLNSAAVYVGIAFGGGLGGLAQSWIAPARLGLPAAAITALAFALTLATTRRPVTGGKPAPASRTDTGHRHQSAEPERT
ncbi:MFS transporter [Actinomadura rudentiformis]|uniref:MFS transporter n=1 Tax=Actinomadura rudentiformis TaxID=359158 RepID=UPI001CEF6612|nr:MFS transporter [Actinomadura rudentiformis]